MRTAIIATIVVSLAHCRKPAGDGDGSDACIGSPSAKHAFVYLHGRDARTPLAQEEHNRDVLRRLARERDARFAIARADTACPDNKDVLCWGWAFHHDELAHTAAIAEAAANKCFSSDTKYVVVGFSNGGYALDAMFARCELRTMLPRATRAVSVGAAMLKGPLGDAPPDLAACGDLTMIAGTKDQWNFDPSDDYLHEMTKRGAHARSVHVEGMGHELVFEPLRDQLFLQTSTTD